MYHLIARCCEAAGLWKNDIDTMKKTTQLETDEVLIFDLTRTKTSTTQKPVIYSHRTSMLWDVYFALGVHLVMESFPQEQLFPKFFNRLNKSNWNGKGSSNESKATKLWTCYNNEIRNYATHFESE